MVKKLMRAQHKAMFIALRDGLFDEDEVAGAKAFAAQEITVDEAPRKTGEIDVAALEKAAAERLANSPARPSHIAQPVVPKPGGLGGSSSPSAPAATSIFGSDVLSEKSLDEVILNYLAEDPAEGES